MKKFKKIYLSILLVVICFTFFIRTNVVKAYTHNSNIVSFEWIGDSNLTNLGDYDDEFAIDWTYNPYYLSSGTQYKIFGFGTFVSTSTGADQIYYKNSNGDWFIVYENLNGSDTWNTIGGNYQHLYNIHINYNRTNDDINWTLNWFEAHGTITNITYGRRVLFEEKSSSLIALDDTNVFYRTDSDDDYMVYNPVAEYGLPYSFMVNFEFIGFGNSDSNYFLNIYFDDILIESIQPQTASNMYNITDFCAPGATLDISFEFVVPNYTVTFNSTGSLINSYVSNLYYSFDHINYQPFHTLPFTLNNVSQIYLRNEIPNYSLVFNYPDEEIGNIILVPNETSVLIPITSAHTFNLYLQTYDTSNDDLERAEADIASLIIGGSIIGDESLPAIGENGSTYTYEIVGGMVDYASINNTTHELIVKQRPPFGANDVTIIVRATATYNGQTASKDFEFTILAYSDNEFKEINGWYYFNDKPNFLDPNSVWLLQDFTFICNNNLYNYISSRASSDSITETNFYLTYNFVDKSTGNYTYSIDVATYTYDSTNNLISNFTWLDSSYRQLYFGSNYLVTNSVYTWLSQNGIFEYYQEFESSEFADIFFALVDSQVYYIKSLLSFDLFGVNLFIAFTSMLTLGLIIYLIKRIL